MSTSMLGIEVDDPRDRERSRDAVGVLRNVVAGTRVRATSAVVHLGAQPVAVTLSPRAVARTTDAGRAARTPHLRGSRMR